MMKKMVMLLMILAVSSLAGAVTISISGPTELQTNATGAYTITLADANIGSFDVDFGSSNTALATSSNVAIVAYDRNSSLDYIGSTFITYEWEASGSADTGHEIEVGNLVTFDVTAGSSKGTFNLCILDVWTTNVSGSQITPTICGLSGIKIVPEPATMVLLGLGGLLLRRKKR